MRYRRSPPSSRIYFYFKLPIHFIYIINFIIYIPAAIVCALTSFDYTILCYFTQKKRDVGLLFYEIS